MRTTHYAGMGGTILASRGLARGFLIPNQDGSKAPRARQAPDYITSQPFAVRTPQIKMSHEFWTNVFPFRIILSVSSIDQHWEIAYSTYIADTTFIAGKIFHWWTCSLWLLEHFRNRKEIEVKLSVKVLQEMDRVSRKKHKRRIEMKYPK